MTSAKEWIATYFPSLDGDLMMRTMLGSHELVALPPDEHDIVETFMLVVGFTREVGISFAPFIDGLGDTVIAFSHIDDDAGSPDTTATAWIKMYPTVTAQRELQAAQDMGNLPYQQKKILQTFIGAVMPIARMRQCGIIETLLKLGKMIAAVIDDNGVCTISDAPPPEDSDSPPLED